MKHARLHIRGRVQGVGFRPFVYRLAQSMGISGRVYNDPQGVVVDLHASQHSLDEFQRKLQNEAPKSARIEAIVCSETDSANDIDSGFHIADSDLDFRGEPTQAADMALCASCLSELFDPQSRRWRHPFIFCAECGPRYSTITDLPYDRKRTSMAAFDPCPSCAGEYCDVSDRRFHAQTLCCHDCGPHYRLLDKNGKPCAETDIFTAAAKLISTGKILALKGIGGFHLICDANNTRAVQRLREIKNRPAKPFAVMALNSASLSERVQIDEAPLQDMESSSAPIMLLPKQIGREGISDVVAPHVSDLGIMLPYTGAHYLLFHALLNKPEGCSWLKQAQTPLLVMTSANVSGSPLISENTDCLNTFTGKVDAFLMHDRDIVASCDDSVVQSGRPSTMIRRARGIAPEALSLAAAIQPTLAFGAYLKNSFCFTQGHKAYLSPFIGDLDSADNCRHFTQVLEHFEQSFGFQPEQLACDLHPDFYSTQIAEQWSKQRKLPLIKVQHHRAHIAAVMAEHHLSGPVIGLALDGVGLGDDGSAWGGELFVGEAGCMERVAHFSPLAMPGGDRAVREIWRLAAAVSSHIHSSAIPDALKLKMNDPGIAALLQSPDLTPTTSSAGRWFDAIASLLDVRHDVQFEAQAAMELEALAYQVDRLPEAEQWIPVRKSGLLDLHTLIAPLLEYGDRVQAAARFHAELIDALLRWLEWAASSYDCRRIVCSGGCFQNRLLRQGLLEAASQRGFEVYMAETVPMNDSGISLGQAWIAAHHNKIKINKEQIGSHHVSGTAG